MNDQVIHPPESDDPEIGRLVRAAYRASVDVETASRHLWRVHHAVGLRRDRGARRTLVSALAAVLLFATTGVAVAMSGAAVPGDSLYMVKRGAERLHLLVSFAPQSEARLHLRFARARVAEAQAIAVRRPAVVPTLLSEVVAAIDSAEAVGDAAVAEEVLLVRREARTTLAALGADADGEIARHVQDVITRLGEDAVVAAEAADEATDSSGDAARGGPQREEARQRTAMAVDGHLATPPPAPDDAALDEADVPDPPESLDADVHDGTAGGEAGAVTRESTDDGGEEPHEEREGTSQGRSPQRVEATSEQRSLATLGRLEGLVDDL